MQTQRLLESHWDYCIVLDACRYDVFSEVYDDYLDGVVEKRRSLGSSTPEWAYRTFTEEYDIAYFSGNPFINDLGVPLNELKWGASCNYEWTANRYIDTVVDVWKDGWDEELGTIPPDNLEGSFRRHRDLVNDTTRTVLHYMQPHAPYLSRGTGQKLRRIQQGIQRHGTGEDNTSGGLLSAMGQMFRPKLERVLEASERAQKVGLWLELDPVQLVRNGTRETAMELYEENLRIVLEAIAELIPELDGRVVVTADHGEAFGEHGVWEHHIETHIPPLMEVPWLVVK